LVTSVHCYTVCLLHVVTCDQSWTWIGFIHGLEWVLTCIELKGGTALFVLVSGYVC